MTSNQGRLRTLAIVCSLLLPCIVSPQPPTAATRLSDVTRELRDLIAADQREPLPPNLPQDPAERERFFRTHWEKHFKPRRDRALQIIQAGRLQSAEDYELAGTLLNHSAYPDDHLVALLLYTTAAYKGSRIARWYSATALDNYLMATQKRQLFGTLWGEPDNPDKDRSSVMGAPMTDALRSEFCVPSVARQTVLLEHLRRGDLERWRREKITCQ